VRHISHHASDHASMGAGRRQVEHLAPEQDRQLIRRDFPTCSIRLQRTTIPAPQDGAGTALFLQCCQTNAHLIALQACPECLLNA